MAGPVKWRSPQPIRAKVPKGRIVPLPLDRPPDIKVGKSLIAASPHRVTAEQLEEARKTLRAFYGKNRHFLINVHATYAVTKKPDGTKQGQGKGSIHHFVARVPAGRALFHVPLINPFATLMPQQSNFSAFKVIASKLPMNCIFRSQNNYFPLDNFNDLTRKRLVEVRKVNEEAMRRKIQATFPGGENE